jgi:Alw26I/Eco31I/Esp3I family type II restriction endonuclease
MDRAHRYGRGKFPAHPRYVDYMRMIVDHPNYRGMPGAVSEDGRINWQVSSGRSTSFHEYYDLRWQWWAFEADRHQVPGFGNSNSRFSVTARLIHPSGQRACRLCGEDRDIGYVYLNDRLARRLNKITGTGQFVKWAHVDAALAAIRVAPAIETTLVEVLPERGPYFERWGMTGEAFEAARHVESNWLSPGYMANPPDRLDGFHDYCLYCRAANDPGRSEENLRSYAHDRRAFEYWAEGDWAMADALFNCAAAGVCVMCEREVDRVSPDHVGPLACGFKQMPLFVPTCQRCNSAKNRRMRLADVRLLVDFEVRTGESVASWHVRGLWDAQKHAVLTDEDAAELSTQLRGLQDLYLRTLYALLTHGHARFLSTLLHPEYAYFNHIFEDLDPSTFTYSRVRTTRARVTAGRSSLAKRSVRIAFEELASYAQKPIAQRRLRANLIRVAGGLADAVLDRAAALPRSELDEYWIQATDPRWSTDEAATFIGPLLEQESRCPQDDAELRAFLEDALSEIGRQLSAG